MAICHGLNPKRGSSVPGVWAICSGEMWVPCAGSRFVFKICGGGGGGVLNRGGGERRALEKQQRCLPGSGCRLRCSPILPEPASFLLSAGGMCPLMSSRPKIRKSVPLPPAPKPLRIASVIGSFGPAEGGASVRGGNKQTCQDFDTELPLRLCGFFCPLIE